MKANPDSVDYHCQEFLHRRLARLACEASAISRMLDDSPAPGTELESLGHARVSGTGDSTTVRREIRMRRLRDRLFPDELFADPAWDLLLDLYAAHLDGRQISVTSACIAACVPQTTALRWIGRLEQHGLLIRSADAFDHRRNLLHLSNEAIDAMRNWTAVAFARESGRNAT